MELAAKVVCAVLALSLLGAPSARGLPPDSADAALGAEQDPRLRRTGDRERVLRQLGDALFARPFFLVRLVAGTALLPVALPTAAVVADWRDGVDMCVTGPYEMLFERPLGE